MKVETEVKIKALVCGLGSIGKRHLNNLERLGFPCEDIAIFRTNRGTVDFGNTVLNDHGDRHPIFFDLEKALTEHGPNIALITNPTSLHVPVAITAAKAGCHLFIEKPLSHTKEGLETLSRVIQQKGLVAHIAYNLRRHPLLIQIKQMLGSGKIGEIISVQAEMAERVTWWHPWEDHTISYACRKDLGGGVILTQSHELDYLYWLFGKPVSVFASGGTNPSLPMDVENVADIILNFGSFRANLHLDYFKYPPKRWLEITGSNGRIFWDYFNGYVEITSSSGEITTIKEPEGYERNFLFLEDLSHFLCKVRGESGTVVSLNEGIDVLDTALYALSFIK